MRTVLLLLMIALLPLRMWAAEGMAIRMAHGQASAAAGVAAMESMPADCPMMAAAQAEGGSGDEAPQAASHCMACHLCAASACLPQLAFESGPAPSGPPVTGTPHYASAEIAPALRPPIS